MDWSEVGNANATGSGTAISVTHGLTILAGDVVVASVHVDSKMIDLADNNGATPTTLARLGFTSDASTFGIYTRLAGASEPAAYAWTASSSQGWSVVVRVFRGIEPSFWDSNGSVIANGLSATAAAPAMTVISNGSAGLMFAYADSSSVTFSGIDNGYGVEVEPGAQRMQASYTKLGLSPGSSGATSVTLSASDNWGAVQCALKPSGTIAEVGNANATGSGTAVSVTHGLTIDAGDVIVVSVHCDTAGTTIVDNNGATPTTKDQEDATSDTSQWAIFSRVAGAAEPAAYAFTLGASIAWSAVVRVFSGVDSSVWDVRPGIGSWAYGTGTALSAPSYPIASPGSLGIAFFYVDSSSATFSAIDNGYGTEVEPGAQRMQAVYTKSLTGASTGATGCTSSASDNWAAVQMVLRNSVAMTPMRGYW